MWNLFSGKKKGEVPIQPIRVDLHSHLIPGIDDGAKTDEESLALLRGMFDLGYRTCITTPHIYQGLYNNTPATIASGLMRLRDICTAHAINIKIEAAAEYFFDNNFFAALESHQLLTFGNKYVLFELPAHSPPAMLHELVFKMNLNGYQPVLAHPERYMYYHDKKMRDYQRLKDLGVLFQLNLMSLTGYYKPEIRLAARDLVRHGMVDFAGSDLHKAKQLAVLQAAQQDDYFRLLIDSGKLLNDTLL
ncbi:MAG TPA: histidinol phosphatase [Chitinophagales bacterium]|nr:histidinol phosphatase [Chitinophagales bacterium]